MARRWDYYIDYVLWSLGFFLYALVLTSLLGRFCYLISMRYSLEFPSIIAGVFVTLSYEILVLVRFDAFKHVRICFRFDASYITALWTEGWGVLLQLAYGWFVWPALSKDPSPSLLAWPLLVPHYILLAGWITSAVIHIYSFDLRRQGLGPIPARVLRRPRVRRWMRRTPVVLAYFFAVIAAACAVARG